MVCLGNMCVYTLHKGDNDDDDDNNNNNNKTKKKKEEEEGTSAIAWPSTTSFM